MEMVFVSQDSAIIRPEDVRQFAAQLQRFSEDLHAGLSSVQAGLDRVGETWRDQEHERFLQVFEETAQVLNRFLEAVDEHVPFLLRKADAAQAYIDQR